MIEQSSIIIGLCPIMISLLTWPLQKMETKIRSVFLSNIFCFKKLNLTKIHFLFLFQIHFLFLSIAFFVSNVVFVRDNCCAMRNHDWAKLNNYWALPNHDFCIFSNKNLTKILTKMIFETVTKTWQKMLNKNKIWNKKSLTFTKNVWPDKKCFTFFVRSNIFCKGQAFFVRSQVFVGP